MKTPGVRFARITMLLCMTTPLSVLSVRSMLPVSGKSRDGAETVLLQADGQAERAAELQRHRKVEANETAKMPNGWGCPIVDIDATLYSGIWGPLMQHQWTTTFIGAVDYAFGSCVQHGASKIQSERVTGKCIMLQQGSPCCGQLLAKFAATYPGTENKMQRITTDSYGNCFRNSDADADFEVFPQIIELTGADCIFANIPIGGSLIPEVYIGDAAAAGGVVITNPLLAYTLAKIPDSRPIKCDLKDAHDHIVCPTFGKNTQVAGPDPRDWADELRAEADTLDAASQVGSSIPYNT